MVTFNTREELDQYEKERVAANKEQKVDTSTGKLSSTPDKLDEAKMAARKISELAFQRSSSPDKSIETATSVLGKTPFSPGAISAAIEGGSVGLKGDIKDIYSMTLDSLTKQDDALKNASDYMMQLSATPELFNLMTSEELEYLKSTGFPPITFANKVAQYMKENPEQDLRVMDIGGNKVLFDMKKQEIVKTIGPSGKPGQKKTAWDKLGYDKDDQTELRSKGFGADAPQAHTDIYMGLTEDQKKDFNYAEFKGMLNDVAGGMMTLSPETENELMLEYVYELEEAVQAQELERLLEIESAKAEAKTRGQFEGMNAQRFDEMMLGPNANYDAMQNVMSGGDI